EPRWQQLVGDALRLDPRARSLAGITPVRVHAPVRRRREARALRVGVAGLVTPGAIAVLLAILRHLRANRRQIVDLERAGVELEVEVAVRDVHPALAGRD